MMQEQEFEKFNRNANNKDSVWFYFLRGKKNKNECKCTTCGKIIHCAGGSTSGMHTHLKAIHNISLLKRSTSSNESSASISSSSCSSSSSYTLSKKLNKSGLITQYFPTDNNLPAVLARLTSRDGLSFRIICTSLDIRLGLTARGFSDIPKSVSGISNIVKNYGNKVKEQLKIEIKKLKLDGQKFSLTFDEWTSIKNRIYLNLNVHATDKMFWNLGLCRVNGTMPAEKCVDIIDAKLKIYNICLDYDIVAITTDGASVMKKVGKIINADQQLCLAHGIQLAILEVLYNKHKQVKQIYVDDDDDDIEEESESEREMSDLKDIDENDEVDSENENDAYLGLHIHNKEINDEIHLNEIIKSLIEKIRKVVRIFRRSPTRNDDFLQKHVKAELGKELKLILDCKTRWNSLLLMLERFYQLKSCVQKALIDVKIEISFTKEELDIVSSIIAALAPVKLAVEALCSRETDLYQADITLEFMLDELSKQENFLSKKLKTALLNRISERRYKHSDLFNFLQERNIQEREHENYGIFNQTSKSSFITQIVSLIERLNFNDATEVTESENIDSEEADDVDIEIPDDSTNSQLTLTLKEKLKQRVLERTKQVIKVKNKSINEIRKIIRAEMNYYIEEGIKGKYLNRVYNYLKTVRPTSVEAERAFSASALLLTKIRSSLSDESIDNLTFLRSYFINKNE